MAGLNSAASESYPCLRQTVQQQTQGGPAPSCGRFRRRFTRRSTCRWVISLTEQSLPRHIDLDLAAATIRVCRPLQDDPVVPGHVVV